MNPTKIQWTDMTWNPVTGCTKISEGCQNCYAEAISKRFIGNFDIKLHLDRLGQLAKMKKPKKIFVCSMSDLFHKDIPNEFINMVWQTMTENNQHIYQILTKRPERLVQHSKYYCWAPQNHIWLGVSVENQKRADERIPLLLKTNTSIKFVSCEPLLSHVSLFDFLGDGDYIDPQIDWVIVGGESGPKFRPLNLDWARKIRNQCQEARVPFFMKQVGGLHGGNWEDIPKDLRIREWPQT